MLTDEKSHAMAWALVIGSAYKRLLPGGISKDVWQKLFSLIPTIEDECKSCDGCKLIAWLAPQFPMAEGDDAHALAVARVDRALDEASKNMCGTFTRAADSAGFGAHVESNEIMQREAVRLSYKMGWAAARDSHAGCCRQRNCKVRHAAKMRARQAAKEGSRN